jgi:hypothetical protein
VPTDCSERAGIPSETKEKVGSVRLLRGKGEIWVQEDPLARFIWQWSGKGRQTWECEGGWNGRPHTDLVLIGSHLVEDAILAELEWACGGIDGLSLVSVNHVPERCPLWQRLDADIRFKLLPLDGLKVCRVIALRIDIKN